jgi:uncharacterized protein YunC (DUF1805 family)
VDKDFNRLNSLVIENDHLRVCCGVVNYEVLFNDACVRTGVEYFFSV